MIDEEKLEEGWRLLETVQNISITNRTSNKYITDISAKINEFEQKINDTAGTCRGIAQEGGFVRETWAAYTLNINELIAGKKADNVVNKLNTLGSPDITMGDGRLVSSKSMATARQSINAQAMTIADRYRKYVSSAKSRGSTKILDIADYLDKAGLSMINENDPLYYKQIRLIPSDQIADGTKMLVDNIRKELAKEMPDYDKVFAWHDTLNNLTDTIKDKNGIGSLPLTKQMDMEIAYKGQRRKFKAKDYGVSTSELIKPEHILKASLKAGLTAAAISAAIQLVPLTIKGIDYLHKYGEIDLNASAKNGALLLSNSAESFLLGAMSCAIYTACDLSPALSAMATNLTPAAIGIAAVFAINTIKYSYQLATGRITAREMGYQLTKQLVIAGCAIAGGAIALAIAPEGNAIAFALGSLVGSLLASGAFLIGEKVFMAFCLDTGYTLFGLVDQNYELSEEMIREIGIDLIDLDYINDLTFDLPFYDLPFHELPYIDEGYIDFKVYKRGVIGFAKIGYLF